MGYKTELQNNNTELQSNNVDLQKILDMILALGLVDVPKVITFTIDYNEFQSEEGMTWAKWVNSDYNVYSFSVGSDNLIYTGEGYAIQNSEYAYVSSTDTIIENANYTMMLM